MADTETTHAALQRLCPTGRPRAPAPPPDPLPIATGSASLQQELVPNAPLFLEPSFAKVLAGVHKGPIRWTIFAASSAELHGLIRLVRKGDSTTVVCGAITAAEEVAVRTISLVQLVSCTVLIARTEKGVATTAAAAAAAMSAPKDAPAEELGPDDVVIPKGFDSGANIRALVDAEGLPANTVQLADEPPAPWAARPPSATEDSNVTAALQKEAADEEIDWRGGLPCRHTEEASSSSAKPEKPKSAFFLKMLGK